jgi:hypothetical protein
MAISRLYEVRWCVRVLGAYQMRKNFARRCVRAAGRLRSIASQTLTDSGLGLSHGLGLGGGNSLGCRSGRRRFSERASIFAVASESSTSTNLQQIAPSVGPNETLPIF